MVVVFVIIVVETVEEGVVAVAIAAIMLSLIVVASMQCHRLCGHRKGSPLSLRCVCSFCLVVFPQGAFQRGCCVVCCSRK